MFPFDNGLLQTLGMNNPFNSAPLDPNEENFQSLAKFLGLNNIQLSTPPGDPFPTRNPLESLGSNDSPQGNGNNYPQQSPVMPPPSDPMLGFQSGAVIPSNPLLGNPMQPTPPLPTTGGPQPLNPQLLQFIQQVLSSQAGQMNMPPFGSPPPDMSQNMPARNPHQNQPPKKG